MSDTIIDPNQPTAPKGAVPKLDLGPNQPAVGAAAPAANLVVDSDTGRFMVDVIETSQAVPVIVQFWSPRSDACRVLTPLLEKLVKRAGGLVRLVRVQAEQNASLAQQLRVQSVPTVFAFKEGRPVDAFAGMQSEHQLHQFIEKLIGDAKPPIEAAMEQADQLLAAGDAVQAEAIYAAILSADATYLPALGGTLRALAAQGEFDRAQGLIDGLDAKTRASADIEKAVSALELSRQSAHIDPSAIDALAAAVAANPKDLSARFDWSLALFAQGRTPESVEQLLEIVRLDRTWNDAAGRKQLLKIFDVLGAADPLTQDARRRLSAVLFS
jgi:putative thioredoxin